MNTAEMSRPGGDGRRPSSVGIERWSIGLSAGAAIWLLLVMAMFPVVMLLTGGRGGGPAMAWVVAPASVGLVLLVIAAFTVNLTSFVKHHRTTVDLVALGVATLLFVLVAIFVSGEFLLPH